LPGLPTAAPLRHRGRCSAPSLAIAPAPVCAVPPRTPIEVGYIARWWQPRSNVTQPRKARQESASNWLKARLGMNGLGRYIRHGILGETAPSMAFHGLQGASGTEVMHHRLQRWYHGDQDQPRHYRVLLELQIQGASQAHGAKRDTIGLRDDDYGEGSLF